MHKQLNKTWHQPVGVVNYPQDREYTRITEYKHLTGQQHPSTSITYEYPCNDGDPYYPVPRPENAELFKRYEQLARSMRDVWFVGRIQGQLGVGAPTNGNAMSGEADPALVAMRPATRRGFHSNSIATE